MFEGHHHQIQESSWQPEAFAAAAPWQEIDRSLRSVAARRAALDAEEAHLLVLARRAEVHRRLGFATMSDYLEHALGYTPHTAAERLRVAEALETLPELRAALAGGRLGFCAVRELTRVATPDTEVAWLARAEALPLRDLEPLVVGRRSGDLPGDPPDPGAVRHRVRFEVSSATLALLRDARAALADDAGERLDDDALVAALCRAVLDGAADAGPDRARHQIAITTCDTCERAWQDGGGAQLEITPTDRAIAECDAQRIGRLDAETPTRAVQDIPPAVRRLVWRRDHGRCVVPGCRSTRFLDVHHLVWRADGGGHEPSNVCLACASHHVAIHEGRLIVRGDMSTGLTFCHADGRPYGAPQPPRDPEPTLVADAISAVHQLGYSATEARGAVRSVASHAGSHGTLADPRRAARARPEDVTTADRASTEAPAPKWPAPASAVSRTIRPRSRCLARSVVASLGRATDR